MDAPDREVGVMPCIVVAAAGDPKISPHPVDTFFLLQCEAEEDKVRRPLLPRLFCGGFSVPILVILREVVGGE